MVRTSLPPGFRFHPTDVELILYYLKRKINGSKFHYEAIAEVNIYKHSPWDLPDKSLLKTMDLEWFFFCPREKKYASGVRVKRATENGFWKTTGRDRIISYNGKTVGTVKTLIFYLGHAPKGERTDWVIHEYKILDDQLAKAGLQDNFVLCKVFKKNGLGPKNGAQYGAPFNEADWDGDDDDDAQNCAIPLADDGPCSTLLMRNEEQRLPLGGSAKGSLPVPEEGPSSSVAVPTSMVAADETTECDGPFPTILMQNEEQCLPLATGFFGFGNVPPPGTGLFGSGNGSLPIPDEGPSSSAFVPTSKGAVDETPEHEMAHLLGLFTDEDILLVNGNGPNKDDLSGNGDKGFLPSFEVDLYDGLDDLDISTGMREHSFDYSLTSILPQDKSMYIELDDLLPPLDCTSGVSGTHLSSLGLASASCNHENIQQLYSGTGFAGLNQYNTFSEYGRVASPYTSDVGDSLVALQMLDHQIYQGPNSLSYVHLPSGQLENAVNAPPHDMMERGRSADNC